MYATKNKYPNIIESILKKLDNPSKRILERNKDGKNSLELAMFRPSNFSKFKKEQKSKALEKRATIMRLLLEHLSPEEKAEEMFFAIKNNLWDAAEMILNSGADVTQKDGSTPSLILALKTKERSNRKEKLEFIKVLITNKDIRLDAEDENGCTALSYAVANQYWEIIDLLVGEEVKISFKLVEEINDQDILDQIIQLGLKPYKEKKGELIKVTNKNEQKNVEQMQERYKLKFMSSSLKDYQNSSLNKKVKEGILEIMKLLKIDPYEVAKKALHGKYGTTDFGDNGYVRAYSAHTKSTKHGRVAYIVIEKLKEVWIIAANDSHYGFMKNKNSSLKDLLNKANFEDFDLNDSDKTISQDNQRDGKNAEENESTLQNNSESSSLSYSSGYETEAELDDKSFGTPEEINTSSIAE